MAKETKKKSVKSKLLAPVIALSVMALALSLLGMVNASKLTAQGHEISDNYLVSVAHLGEIGENVQKISRLVFSAATTPVAEQSALTEEIDAAYAESAKVLEEFESNMDEEERDAYNDFRTIYDEHMVAQWDVLKPLMGTDMAAVAITSNSGALRLMVDSLEESLDILTAKNDEAADAAVASMEAAYQQSVGFSVVMIVLTIGLVLYAILTVIKQVSSPLVNASKQCMDICDSIRAGQGDLTKRIEVKSNDEIGELRDGINQLLDILQGILGQIVSGSTRLSDIVSAVSGNVSTSNGSAQGVSAAMEELSATMEEIAASLQNISNNTDEVENQVAVIAARTEELNNYSKDMNTRADEMASSAQQNKEHTTEMIGDIVGKLRQAIEDSKSVEKVNELTDEILSISSQTNLLALNASIEAARAGEAGKGFAVVADEIRQLADSSRETANNIQAINTLVTQAVKALAGNSNEIINYIEETVLVDYDNFVENGQQYRDDAVYISDTMRQFAQLADRLKSVVDNTVDAIEGISVGVEESANAVSNSAESTATLVDEMSNIDLQMDENQNVVGALINETKVFVKY